MKFEWDEAKQRINFEKHGFDFRDVKEVFQGPIITAKDDRQEYGERRFITLGLLGDAVVVIVHTPRGEKTRIISMRKAKAKEKRAYEEKILLGYEAYPRAQG